jgi:PAS domain S-box-containing protein
LLGRGVALSQPPDHRSEEALRLALDEQRHLLEDLDVIVWKMEPSTLAITYVTGAAAALGYPASAWIDDATFFAEVLLHPQEKEPMLTIVRAVAADGQERQSLHRVASASGGERWFRTRVRAQRASDGRVRGLLGVMLDVTERVSTESRLRESEAHLRRLVDQLPAVIWTTDRDLRFTSGVGRELEVLGVPASSALLGVSIQEYLNIVDPNDHLLANYRRALAGERVSVEVDWLGSTYQTHVEPFRDAAGEIVGILAVSWNITERRRAENNLRLLAEASATLAESLDYEETLRKTARLAVGPFADWCVVCVIEGDRLRTVAGTHVDPAKEVILRGLPSVAIDELGAAGEVIRSGRSVLIPDVPEGPSAPGPSVPLPEGAAGEQIAEALRTLGLRSMLVVPLVARDQTLGMLILCRSAPHRPYTPADLGVAEDLGRRCAMAIDRALLYRTAQTAIEARDDFLSVASHELRTPLTSIQLRLESLVRSLQIGRPVTLTGQQGALTVVLKQFKRLATLVEQLLDVSRIRRGAMDLVLEDVDLAEVVRDVGARFEADVARAGSTLSIVAPEPAVGRWDRVRIEQVVTDLLSNAVKFARGTSIAIEVAKVSPNTRLIVRDRGMGISVADQARIFERFERAASSRHFGGLGLGLYITRQIVAAHGGSVALESAPGAGTTVVVELPPAPPATP